MKALFILGLLVSQVAQAQNSKEQIIGDNTYTMTVALNEKTVLCLRGDYGGTSFKIAIPEIDDVTFLDHTSPGAPGPCINAGFCQTQGQPDFMATTDDRMPIFHDVTKPTEIAQVRVIRKEVSEKMGTECVRSYVENISSTIRGTEFKHTESMPLATLDAKFCE